MNFNILLKKKTIVLHGKGLRDEDLAVISEVLRKSTRLSSLYLWRNEIALADRKFVGALTHSCTMRDLHLEYNDIGPEGAQRLAAMLRSNTTLRKLGLEGNRIGEGGCKALAGALTTNGTLEEISLGGNGVGDAGSRWLAASLWKNRSLRVMGLCENKIGEEGARLLVEAIKHNPVVEEIDLGDHADIGQVQAIQAALDDPKRKTRRHERIVLRNDERVPEIAKAANDKAFAGNMTGDAIQAKTQTNALSNPERKVRPMERIVAQNDTERAAKDEEVSSAANVRAGKQTKGEIPTVPTTTPRNQSTTLERSDPHKADTAHATTRRPQTPNSPITPRKEQTEPQRGRAKDESRVAKRMRALRKFREKNKM